MSHSTLRAKRATSIFWVDIYYLKIPKMVHFLKTWSFLSNSITRQVSFNRTKIVGKCQNSNATFWVTFKQCVYVAFHDDYFKYLINVLHTVTIDPSVSWPTMYLLGKKVHWRDVICSKISVDAKKTAVGNCIIFSSLPFGQAKATLNFFRQKSFLICPGCCFCGLKSRPRLFLLSHTTISRP